MGRQRPALEKGTQSGIESIAKSQQNGKQTDDEMPQLSHCSNNRPEIQLGLLEREYVACRCNGKHQIIGENKLYKSAGQAGSRPLRSRPVIAIGTVLLKSLMDG